ncbi:MAG TPA: inositol monophosphatase family protein [Gemmatimonadales bacterium]|nr:inositol monophosphatase family protein [Gemmatimonadales bacterium]
MDPTILSAALEAATAAAQAPAERILRTWRSPGLAAETKADGSPVTAADRDAEAIVRAALRSSAGVGQWEMQGEECGLDGGPSPYRWLIDPIDGTRAYTRGLPTFGTIVALEDAATGRGLVGAIHLAAERETLSASRNRRTERNGVPVRASAARELRTAIVSRPDLAEFRAAGLEGPFHELHERCDRVRGYTDCWAHAQVIAGAVDALVEPGLSPWDIRATQVLVEEAGGAQLTRPSQVAGKVDCIIGSPHLVEQLAVLFGF